MPLSLDSRFCGNVFVVECRGRIVAGEEVRSLEAFLLQRAREFTRLVLNMSQVDRLDSLGIGLLVRFASNLGKNGGGLRLAGAPPFMIKLLDMTMLSTLLPVDPTEDEAIVSLLKHRPASPASQRQGPSVLFVDPSSDLCAFVRAVLTQNGFDVKPTCLLHDAKIMLRVDKVDFVVAGPGTPKLPAESIIASLRSLAPTAKPLQLDAAFPLLDPAEGAKTLLQMFEGVSGA